MIDRGSYREAIAHFATGVTVITTVTDDGPAGMTASAVSSVSLDPILLLVCVDHRLPTSAALERSRCFAVNVLGAGHEHLARHFATPARDKFAGVALRAELDLPVLEEAIAYFLCDVYERLPGGDHSIFLGRVRECAYEPGREPLLYFRSGFTGIRDPTPPIHVLGHPLA